MLATGVEKLLVSALIKVISDTAEREVKTSQNFNCQFTKDESQKQFILKTVIVRCRNDDNYRSNFSPSHVKMEINAP